jgi:hypothetical protein
LRLPTRPWGRVMHGGFRRGERGQGSGRG